jgi:hypothetical protein
MITDAKKALSRMLNGFNWGGDETEKKLKLDAYWDVLGGLPSNVIIAACAAAARGELCDDRRFPPTAAIVYERAISYLPRPNVKPLEPERVIPPAERERITIGFNAVAKELAERNAVSETERIPSGRWSTCSRWAVTAGPLSELSKEALAKVLK